MTEWSVVLVIISLVGLGAVIIKPVVSLTKSITTLTVVVENLQKDVNLIIANNRESHERIWRHEQKQDARLDDHETRMIKMEGK